MFFEHGLFPGDRKDRLRLLGGGTRRCRVVEDSAAQMAERRFDRLFSEAAVEGLVDRGQSPLIKEKETGGYSAVIPPVGTRAGDEMRQHNGIFSFWRMDDNGVMVRRAPAPQMSVSSAQADLIRQRIAQAEARQPGR